MTARRFVAWLAGLAVAVGVGGPVGAASWGGIVPGETTRRQVIAEYGPPSRERMVLEEGRSVPELTYVGARAPRGLERMVVSFGLIRSGQFDPEIVRALTIYPKPRVFGAVQVAVGWGVPDAIGTDEPTKRSVLKYEAKGLIVIMDPTGGWAEMMLFAPAPPPAKP